MDSIFAFVLMALGICGLAITCFSVFAILFFGGDELAFWDVAPGPGLMVVALIGLIIRSRAGRNRV